MDNWSTGYIGILGASGYESKQVVQKVGFVILTNVPLTSNHSKLLLKVATQYTIHTNKLTVLMYALFPDLFQFPMLQAESRVHAKLKNRPGWAWGRGYDIVVYELPLFHLACTETQHSDNDGDE